MVGRAFFRPLPRPDVIAALDRDGLLPAITFRVLPGGL